MTSITESNLHVVRKTALLLEEYARDSARKVQAFIEWERQAGRTDALAKHLYELEQWEELQADAVRQLRQVNSLLGLPIDSDVPVQVTDLSEVLF